MNQGQKASCSLAFFLLQVWTEKIDGNVRGITWYGDMTLTYLEVIWEMLV
jgi:hypothetical protein